MFRFRRQVACLDNALALTLGSPLAPLAILSYLNPIRGIYTGITLNPNDGARPIGQVQYRHGRRSARLTFLLPENDASLDGVVALLEKLTIEAGSWGALNILAEVDENCPLYSALYKAGFVVYGRQQVWQINAVPKNRGVKNTVWQPAMPVEEIAIRSLYQSLIPPLVQSAEASPESYEECLVYRQDRDELLACTQVRLGPCGVYAQPLFHPGVNNSIDLLTGLVAHFTPHPERPLYLGVRSYQAGLESDLVSLNASRGTRQVLMVKYMTNIQRLPAYNHNLSVLEKRRAEPSAPIVSNLVQPPPVYPDPRKN